jgi:PPOX class probable F420-dependent enzyme
MEIDTSSEFGARVAGHLAEDAIVWLSTVGPDAAPQPSPVWFFWNGETVLIYSQPGTPKLRNIVGNPRVSLHFNSDPYGGDVVILSGDAWIDTDAPPASENPDYLGKYTEGIASIGMSPEAFAQAYAIPVRVRPTALRGH